ncbi:carbonic anhydrase family protein [Schlegelella sp. ID0723]|uniref:carbonic anhydrase n=1 Tax=Piscinibacter koreensis TaxID=2742824 RepID=A0A7Y6NP14_9BURK|nr:carbonic anhydrase family protein [Schlegelella koreensis]
MRGGALTVEALRERLLERARQRGVDAETAPSRSVRATERVPAYRPRVAAAPEAPPAAVGHASALARPSSSLLLSSAPPAFAHAPGGSPAHGNAAAPAALATRAALPGSIGQGADVHWSYDGAGGPTHWGALRPEFATCAQGSRQSPIDIRDGIKVDLEPVRFDYRPGAFRVVDNGHTVQVDVAPGNSIEVLGRRFDLLQFHFHRPSEERIDGRQYDMVVHLVHKDLDGRLAVVAVLLERGGPHTAIQHVWNNLPLEKGDAVAARDLLDPAALLPADRRYYTYMGSLTTPPCSEGVLWMVLKTPQAISAEQIGIFARLYPMNARPLQQASSRLIKESN